MGRNGHILLTISNQHSPANLIQTYLLSCSWRQEILLSAVGAAGSSSSIRVKVGSGPRWRPAGAPEIRTTVPSGLCTTPESLRCLSAGQSASSERCVTYLQLVWARCACNLANLIQSCAESFDSCLEVPHQPDGLHHETCDMVTDASQFAIPRQNSWGFAFPISSIS